MNAHLPHSTHRLRLGLLALASVASCGCWEEIHYTPPGGGTAQESPRPTDDSRDDGEAAPAETGFADEVAATRVPAGGEVASHDEPASADVEPSPEVATAPPPEADPSRNTRRVAWLLGSKLSLAALANDRGADANEVAKWFDQSRRLAEILGTTVNSLPLPAADGAPATNGIDYLFAEGQRIGRDLAVAHGDDHAAAFELAVKANILLALYQPGAKVAEALAAGIEDAGRRAGLPAEFLAPLSTAVAGGRSPSDVRGAVYEMYRQVDEHLTATPP